MAEQVAGFPYWEVRFDDRARLAEPARVEALLADLPRQALTDLFLFSHGWNNDRQMARNLYGAFFATLRAVLDNPPPDAAQRPATIGTLGIIWPARRWADEDLPTAVGASGGAVALARPRTAPPATDAELVSDLSSIFKTARQRRALKELARLLDERPDDPAALERFQRLMGDLDTVRDAVAAPEDSGERRGLLEDDARAVFQRFADQAPRRGRRQDGGAAAFGFGGLDRLWDGAREALRMLTYSQMKKRAGVVGKEGLGPLLGRLHAAQPDLRLHLLGHSFGARLVSFALAGLPMNAGSPSPVKSVILLQGAFSHFAFASRLPFDPGRGGALAHMASRVDGPIVASHSAFDTAVGRLYPLASLSTGDDAAAWEDRLSRWGAIGYDGAQAVDAAGATLGAVGSPYTFAAGQFVNLDGNGIITRGGPPAGAHGDIFHPEIAWATLAASGVVATP